MTQNEGDGGTSLLRANDAPSQISFSLSVLCLGMIAATVAVAGFAHFLLAPSITGEYVSSMPAGYNVSSMFGIAAWVYLGPFSLVALLTTTFDVTKRVGASELASGSWLLFWTLTFAAAFVSLAVYLWKGPLGCLALLCVDDSTTKVASLSGFMTYVGLGCLAVAAVLCTAFAAAFVSRLRPSEGSRTNVLSDMSQRARSRKVGRICCGLLLIFGVLPGCLILTALLPNSFSKFTRSGISAQASQHVTTGERPGAWLRTVNLQASESAVLNLFPDCLMFYGFLEVLAICGAVAALVPRAGRFFGKRLVKGFTVGEIFALCLTVIFFALWSRYWLHDHVFSLGEDIAAERIARWFGVTASMFMGLALLPASRNSMWLETLGISWEAGLWAHRWLGAASLLSTLGHIVCFWIRFGQLNLMPHDALAIPPYYPLNGMPKSDVPKGNDWTVPLMQLVAYPALFAMGLLPLVREKYYEVFKYAHFIFLALIPAALIHAQSAWYYMLGGAAFWLVDAAIRFTSAASMSPVQALVAHQVEGGVTELRFTKFFQEPGQYVFINVPEVSRWEWHPFSLCGSPLDDEAQLCIKAMTGESTFTSRLYGVASSRPAGSAPLLLHVDGPYGPALDLDGFEAVLLLGAGIGITPVHSAFRYLSQLAERGALPPGVSSVTLAWIVRTRGMVDMLAPSLGQCLAMTAGREPRFHVLICLSGAATEEDADTLRGLGVDVRLGRPDLGELCAEAEARAPRLGKVLFRVCGPQAVAEGAERAASKRPRVVLEPETFKM